jgi:Ca2+/Na+ antiporter
LRSSPFLLGFSPTIEAELYEWLLMFSTFIRTRFFIFYMLIEPPNQTFTEFYMNRNFMVSCLGAASNLVYYIAHDLHPSRIVMPLLLLLYGLLLYDSYMHPTMQHAQQVTSQPIFDRHYTVDCRFGLPATYMVFSCIMYVPNYIQLLRNRHRIYAMNACLSNYLVVDAIRYALFFGYVCVLLPLREPPRKFITDGVCRHGIAQSTRAGNIVRRLLKLLFYALVTFFVTNSPFAPFRAPRHHLSLQAAISQYRTSIDAWAKREKEECQARYLHDIFMAQLEQKSSARIVDFDADAFDIATDNCASKTSTPYLSDLYESTPIENAALSGGGKSTVTHIGKA